MVKYEGREEVEHEKNDAPRGQNTPPPGSGRHLCLKWPGPLWDRTVRRFSGEGLPLPATPSLAGSAGPVIDSSALLPHDPGAGEEEEGRRRRRSRRNRRRMC